MNINNQAFELHGVTVQEYLDFCKKKNWQAYKTSSKRAFFERLDDGRLVRGSDGKLHEKKPRKNKPKGGRF